MLIFLIVFAFAVCQSEQERKVHKTLNNKNAHLGTYLVGCIFIVFLIPALVLLCADSKKNAMIGGEVYVEKGSGQTNNNGKPVTNSINLKYGNTDQDLGFNSMNQGYNQQQQQQQQFNGPPQYNDNTQGGFYNPNQF
ncbi:shisa [Anaeramoeba flamelloides]|uniref:Shisa n=1 Tax=Anaeramoeba flamelloides TaxID=1746091 RepID=A0ABQ8YLC7_9EUKA|nr:shisa [Anaeramoeba flamelloides]